MAKALNTTFAATETSLFAIDTIGEGYAAEMLRTFDVMFSEYVAFQRHWEYTHRSFAKAAETFNVEPGSPHFLRLMNTRCGGVAQTLEDMGKAMDGITKLIRDMPISGPKSLLVKAKALQFDCGLLPMEGPLNDWDWNEECLHIFIAQVSDFVAWRAL